MLLELHSKSDLIGEISSNMTLNMHYFKDSILSKMMALSFSGKFSILVLLENFDFLFQLRADPRLDGVRIAVCPE